MTSPTQDEVNFWKKQVVESKRTQLDTVRKAATSWSTLFAAVLGVFGTVAFAGGLTSLEDLEKGLQLTIKLATLLAAALVLAATVLAGLASGVTARTTSDSDWEGFRTQTNQQADDALARLEKAKVCGALAAAIVLVGSAVVLLAGESAATPKTPPTVVAVVDGVASCGKLTKVGDELQVGAVRLSAEVESLIVVDECP